MKKGAYLAGPRGFVEDYLYCPVIWGLQESITGIPIKEPVITESKAGFFVAAQMLGVVGKGFDKSKTNTRNIKELKSTCGEIFGMESEKKEGYPPRNLAAIEPENHPFGKENNL